ncbi:WD40 repeat domain-containing protein [Frankia nepalensis]|uniref:Uncharacterized protein n=1 Tax=Frankia nepalensis TaxID=1836974 RepID=A0A937RHQ6_9ACTN|nr:WD40 repeat domain-containing protein [Frankia nepalensis]MBL7502339.1 hypothetical protein [Frankia nepalensis]MBL7632451.1 hypothetical protein [Frankia nepalensis]
MSSLASPHLSGSPLTARLSGAISVAFAPDDRTFASGSSDHQVLLWTTG